MLTLNVYSTIAGKIIFSHRLLNPPGISVMPNMDIPDAGEDADALIRE